MKDAVEQVGNNFKANYADSPFYYFFLDDFYHASYKSDTQFGQIFGLFSILAIIVACLGLFGLSSYTVLQRTKEVGIRKVLGAPIPSLFRLLTVDFLKPIVVAVLIALPVMYYLLGEWLKDYAFRIELGWWLFTIPFVIILSIALLTVLSKTIEVVFTNPVNSLRNE